jgi:pimeloyl-ACP methyl ester carboxylesterase
MAYHIIYVPGLGDHNSRPQKRFLKHWRVYGVKTHFQQVNWHDDEPFESKLKRVLESIDKFAGQGQVSLVGVSAGASLALAAYSVRKQQISRVVYICGKLQNPDGVNQSYFQKNPAFQKSVFSAPGNIDNLSNSDKAKMLTFRAFKDTVIPVRDSKIPGVQDKTIPAIGHVFSIFLALTLYAKSITNFMKWQ